MYLICGNYNEYIIIYFITKMNNLYQAINAIYGEHCLIPVCKKLINYQNTPKALNLHLLTKYIMNLICTMLFTNRHFYKAETTKNLCADLDA